MSFPIIRPRLDSDQDFAESAPGAFWGRLFRTGWWGAGATSLIAAGLSVMFGMTPSAPDGLAPARLPRHFWKGADEIAAVRFDSAGGRLFALDRRGGLLAFDLKTGRVDTWIKGGGWTIRALALSPDGRTLATAGVDGGIALYDTATGRPRSRIGVGGTRPPAALTVALAYAGDGRTLAAGTYDGTLQVWDMVEGRLQAEIPAHTRQITCLAVDHRGQALISGSADGTARVWDRGSGRCVRTIEHEGSPVGGLALAPDDRTLAVGFAGGKFRQQGLVLLADLRSVERPTRSLGEFTRTTLAFAPDGRTLAGGSFDAMVRLWDVPSGQLRAVLDGHHGFLRDIAFAPDGRRVASAGYDGLLGLFELSPPAG